MHHNQATNEQARSVGVVPLASSDPLGRSPDMSGLLPPRPSPPPISPRVNVPVNARRTSGRKKPHKDARKFVDDVKMGMNTSPLGLEQCALVKLRESDHSDIEEAFRQFGAEEKAVEEPEAEPPSNRRGSIGTQLKHLKRLLDRRLLGQGTGRQVTVWERLTTTSTVSRETQRASGNSRSSAASATRDPGAQSNAPAPAPPVRALSRGSVMFAAILRATAAQQQNADGGTA